MANGQDKLELFYNEIEKSGAVTNLPDYNTFKNVLQDKKTGKMFLDNLRQVKFDNGQDVFVNLPDYDEFVDVIGLKKKDVSGVPYKDASPSLEIPTTEQATDYPAWSDYKDLSSTDEKLTEADKSFIAKQNIPELSKWRNGIGVSGERMDYLIDSLPIGTFAPPDDLSPTEQFEFLRRSSMRKMLTDDKFRGYVDYLMVKDKEKQQAIEKGKSAKDYLRDVGYVGRDVEKIDFGFDVNEPLNEENFNRMFTHIPELDDYVSNKLGEHELGSAEAIGLVGLLSSAIGKLGMLYKAATQSITQMTGITPDVFSYGVTPDVLKKTELPALDEKADKPLDIYRDDIKEINQYLSTRDLKFWERTAGGILGLAADAPLFNVGGRLGIAATDSAIGLARWTKNLFTLGGVSEKVAEQAVKQGFSTFLKASVKGTAGALAFHSGVSDALNQIGDKPLDDYYYGQTLRSMFTSGLTGAAIGVIPPITHAVANTFTQRALDKMFTRNYVASAALRRAAISSKMTHLAGFGTEVSIFELSHMLQGGKVTWDSVAQNAATLGALKLGHVGRIESDAKDRNVEFTNSEYNILNSKKGLSARIKTGNDVKDFYTDKNSFNKLMADDNVPFMLKAKAAYLIKGLKKDAIPLPDKMITEDGVFKIYDRKNNLLDILDERADPELYDINVINVQRKIVLLNDIVKAKKITEQSKVLLDDLLKKNGVEGGVEDGIFMSSLFVERMTPEQAKAARILNDVLKGMETVHEPIPEFRGEIFEERVPVPSIEGEVADGGGLFVAKDKYIIRDNITEERVVKDNAEAENVIDQSLAERNKIADLIRGRERQQESTAEYRIFDKEFKTEAEFIEGLKEFAKDGISGMDYFGKDIVYKPSKEIEDIISNIEQKEQVPPERMSTDELTRMENVYSQRIRMAEYIKDLIRSKEVKEGLYEEKTVEENLFGRDVLEGIKEIKEEPKPLTEEQQKRQDEINRIWEETKVRINEARNTPKQRVNQIKEMLSVKDRLKETIKKELIEKGFNEDDPDFAKTLNREVKNRNPFRDIPDKVFKSMQNKVDIAKKDLSDTSIDAATRYIDKILTDAEFRRHESIRLGDIEKITEKTAERSILERTGKKPKLKKRLRDITDDFARTIKNIHELVTTGKSFDYENPNEMIDIIDNRLDELVTQDEMTRDDWVEYVKLKSEREVLEYANIHEKGIYEVKMMLDNVNRFIKNQKSRSREVYETMEGKFAPLTGTEGEIVTRMYYGNKEAKQIRKNKELIKELEAKENKTPADISLLSKLKRENTSLFDKMMNVYVSPPTNTKKYLRSIESTSFWSLNSMFMRNDPYSNPDMPVYKDFLNEQVKDIVLRANDKLDTLIEDMYNRVIPRVMDIVQARNEGHFVRILSDMATDRRIKLKVMTQDGEMIELADMTPMQAMQKILQWSDPDWNKLMSMPYVNVKSGSGYTDEVIESLINQLSPKERALMSFMKENVIRYADMYEVAYISENGVSFRKERENYWMGRKESYEVRPVEIGDYEIGNLIKQERTMRRTGDMSPLVRGSAWDDFTSFMDEAIRYVSWAEGLRELQYIYKDNAIRRAIKHQFGTKALDAVDNRITLFAGNQRGTRFSAIDELNKNVAASILGFKIKPVMKQLVSMTYYLAEVPTDIIIDSMKGVAKDPAKYLERNYELVDLLANQPFYVGRVSSVATALGLEMDNLMRIKSRTPKQKKIAKTLQNIGTYIPKRQFVEVSGKLLQAGDVAPILVGGTWFTAMKYKQYSGKELTNEIVRLYKNGVEDVNLKKAISDWAFMSEVSQQSIRESNKSYFSRSTLGGILTTFTTGQLAAHRLVSAYIRDARKAIASKDKNMALNAIKGLGVVWILGESLFSLMDDRFKIKNKKTLKNLAVSLSLGNTTGIAGVGRVIELAKQYGLDQHYGREGALPISAVIKPIEETVGGLKNLADLMTANVKDQYRIEKELSRLAVAVSMLYGVPVDGILKIRRGILGAMYEAHPVVSFETFGMFGSPEKDMPESVDDLIAELKISPYENEKEAAKDIRYNMAFSKDGRSLKYDMDQLILIASRIAASPNLKDYQNPVSSIINRAWREMEYERFKRLYNQYNQLDTDKGLQLVIDVVTRRLDKETDADKRASLAEDLDKLRTMQEDRLEWEYDVIGRIYDGADAMYGITDKAYDKGIKPIDVSKKRKK